MIKPEKYTISLIILSLVVISAEYGYIDISGISGSILGFSIEGSMIKDKMFVTILELSALVGLLVAHSVVSFREKCGTFISAYRYYPKIVDELQQYIINKTGRSNYGSPVGNINPSIFNKEHKFGKYQRLVDERYLDINFTFSSRAHLLALKSAAFSTVVNLGLSFWFPVVLCIWALTMAIT